MISSKEREAFFKTFCWFNFLKTFFSFYNQIYLSLSIYPGLEPSPLGWGGMCSATLLQLLRHFFQNFSRIFQSIKIINVNKNKCSWENIIPLANWMFYSFQNKDVRSRSIAPRFKIHAPSTANRTEHFKPFKHLLEYQDYLELKAMFVERLQIWLGGTLALLASP